MDIYTKLMSKIPNDKLGQVKKVQENNEKIKRMLVVSIIILLVGMVISAFRIFPFKILGVAILVLAVFIVILVYTEKYVKSYAKNVFKKNVVPYLIAEISDNITFNSINYVGPEILEYADLEIPLDIVDGEDYLYYTEKNGKFNLELSEISARYYSSEDLSFFEKMTETKFEGVFAHAQFNSGYIGQVRIFNKENVLDKYSKLREKENKVINLESVDFQDKYDVYATEQINVRRILTPTMMEKIQEAEELVKGKIEISIIDNELFIKVDCKDFLDSYSRNSIIYKNRINRDYTLIKTILELSDNLINNIEKISI